MSFASSAQRRAFIRAETAVLAPPLVPEVRLHLAHEAVPLWQKTEEELGEIGLPPPFWAFAWAGGQALARHVLDHPALVAGKRVFDIASGSGLAAIASLKAGAAAATTADIDAYAAEAALLNAELNGFDLEVICADLLSGPPPDADVVLAGDLFYEKSLAERAFAFLSAAQARGATVLIGDPGRSYCPMDRLTRIASHAVPVTRDLEDAEIKNATVWRLKSG